MTDLSKEDPSSKADENENDNDARGSVIHGLRPKCRNLTSLRAQKSSGQSSDDETTSSSLLPIPDTLRQMRGELKRITLDTREHPDDSVRCSTRIITEDVTNSLNELRRKYSIRNEASVTMKMNSANLMLDDILSGSSLVAGPMDSNFRSKFAFEDKKIQESDTASFAESVSTMKHSGHEPSLSVATVDNQNPQVAPYDPIHRHCKIHGKVYRPTCTCSSSFCEKGLRVVGTDSDEKQKKLSLLEKLQNLQLMYRIQSVYKIVQKSNPFSNRYRREDSSMVEQGIPNSSYHENGIRRQDPKSQKCDGKRCAGNHYPRRMVFDLVESSEGFQSDEKSSTREDEENCSCPVQLNCTCQRPGDCTCPELIPCTCYELPKFEPECCSIQNQQHSNYQNSIKVNEFVQTDSYRGSVHDGTRQGVKVELNDEAPENTGMPNPRTESTNQSAFHSLGPPEPAKFFPTTQKLKKQSQKEFSMNYQDWKRRCFKERKLIERTDIYYFDHGNSSYYRTTDNHPVRYTECLVERTDEYANKFWGEIFGVIEVGIAFIVSFILQLYRFLFTSIIRSLTVGLLQIFSDYFFKPLLTIIFNGLIQPCLILGYNIATSVRDLCFPVSQTFGFFIKEIANLFKSCRLVDINHNHEKLPSCNCGNKVLPKYLG